eukprot:Nitzschia sp. Nitz4//scaffold15_size197535//63319//64161//NITZ4_001571-RA/size197535-processed-gene-0.12-mRNA-1//1//CDS//3329537694//7061//frame0
MNSFLGGDKALMDELKTVTEQLTQTRQSLWSTQDQLRDALDKCQRQELHIEELVSAQDTRQQDLQKQEETITSLKQENSQSLEEQVKLRDSLNLMKKVFTRNQLKSKEEHETIALLAEESDLLRADLLKEKQFHADTRAKLQEAEKLRSKSDSQVQELREMVEKLYKDRAQFKERFAQEKKNSQRLQSQLHNRANSSSVLTTTDAKRSQQRRVMDSLERQVLELRDDEVEGPAVVHRAFLDEDLEDGITRQFMDTFDCTSYTEDMPNNVYPMNTKQVFSM